MANVTQVVHNISMAIDGHKSRSTLSVDRDIAMIILSYNLRLFVWVFVDFLSVTLSGSYSKQRGVPYC